MALYPNYFSFVNSFRLAVATPEQMADLESQASETWASGRSAVAANDLMTFFLKVSAICGVPSSVDSEIYSPSYLQWKLS